MQPFLKIPIHIQNSEKEHKEIDAFIRPNEIEYFYPGFYEGTVIVMKSGSSMLSRLSPPEFEKVLSVFEKSTKSAPGKFGVLEIK